MKFQRALVSKQLAVLVVLLVAFLVPRSFSLGHFVAIDEVNWLHRSANFYSAIVNRDWDGTYLIGHPGIVTAWVGSLAFRIAAPDYRVTSDLMLTSYTAFERKLSKVTNQNPIALLALSRAIMISLLTALLLLCYLYSQRLFGILPSLIGFLIIALDPFLIALSRMSHLDAPQAVFMFLSILAFLAFINRGNRWLDLVISGMAGGLAFLSKSPGILIVPAIGVVALWSYFSSKSRKKSGFSISSQMAFIKVVQSLLLWAIIFCLTYTAFWPSMWVKPVNTLERVLNVSAHYTTATDEIGNTEQAADTIEDASRTFTSIFRYPVTFLWRTTPIVLLGLFSLVASYFLRKYSMIEESALNNLKGLLFLLVIYTIGMTLPRAGSEKYYAPAYLVLDYCAGLGWYYFAFNMITASHVKQRKYLGLIVTIIVIATQSVWVYQTFPYYFTYYNPLLGGLRRAAQVRSIGVGEGLDEAGRYLMNKPNSTKLNVMAWYGTGPLSYYFNGNVIPLYRSNSEWTPELIQKMSEMDYLVVYSNQKFRNQPPELIELLRAVKPEKAVAINSVEYAWIYLVSDIPLPEPGLVR